MQKNENGSRTRLPNGHRIAVAVTVLLIGGIVGATTYLPFKASGGMATTPSSSWGGPDGSSGIYERGDAGITYHKGNNTEVVLGAGGGGSLPTGEIGYGTGTGVTSSADFEYDPTTGLLLSGTATSSSISGDSALGVRIYDSTSQNSHLILRDGGNVTELAGAGVTHLSGAPLDANSVFFNDGRVELASRSTPTAIGEIGWNGTNFVGSTNGSTWDVTLVSLSTANTWTAAQNVASAALTYGSTISTNAALGNSFGVTLTGNPAIANPTNLVSGGTYQYELIQDSTGSRTVTWGSVFKWPGGSAPTLQTAAGAKDLISCYYDGADLLCGSLASGGGGSSGIGGSIASGQIAIGASTSNQIQGSNSLTYASNVISGDPTGGLTIQDSTSNNSSLQCSSTAATLTAGTGASKVQVAANSSDTSVDYSLGGTLLASLGLGTIISGSVAFVASASATYLGFFDSSFNGFKIQSGDTYIRTGGADLVRITGAYIEPFNDAGFSVGADGKGIRAVTLTPITAPGAPSGTGQMRLYVDTADNKLKAIASTGTVTVVASP